MNASDPIRVIREDKLLVVVRLRHVDDAVAEALRAGGLRAVEISLVSGDPFAAIRRWGASFESLVVGAGTVVTRDDAERAIEAGARYLVSPGYSKDVAASAKEGGVPYLPGALTPTEIQEAVAAGAVLVKLFPAGRLGPGYVRDLLGPFPTLELVATGGVDQHNARSFLDAGAAAVAVGGSLVSEGRSPAELTKAVEALRTEIVDTNEGGERRGG